MKVLLKKTFIKMFKPVSVLVSVLISGALGFVLSRVYLNLFNQNTSYSNLALNIEIMYIVFGFVFLSGLVIWVIVANYATGLFASEIHEGTIRLLLSKPISRLQLVLGKILGLFLGAIGYLLIIYATFIFSFTLFSQVEKDILEVILKDSIMFIGYGIVLIFIIGSIGSFLSSCFKKKAPAVILLVFLAMIVFGIIPIMRLYMQDIYNSWHLYYFDINYHLALISHQFFGLMSNLEAPLSQLNMLNLFTNLFINAMPDYDLGNYAIDFFNNSLNGTLIMIVYIAGSCLLYGLTYKNILNKDI